MKNLLLLLLLCSLQAVASDPSAKLLANGLVRIYSDCAGAVKVGIDKKGTDTTVNITTAYIDVPLSVTSSNTLYLQSTCTPGTWVSANLNTILALTSDNRIIHTANDDEEPKVISNPSAGFFTLQFAKKDLYNVQVIYADWGLLMQESKQQVKEKQEVKVALPKGSYVIKVTDSKNVVTTLKAIIL